jgi:hypothetical protein
LKGCGAGILLGGGGGMEFVAACYEKIKSFRQNGIGVKM